MPDREVDMANGESGPQQERIRVFNSYREQFASAPIRLMSRTASAMRAKGYDDLATAIGDLDWRTVPSNDPEDPMLREDWGRMLAAALDNVGGWMEQLGSQPLGYNLDSIGYPAVTRAWSRLWSKQLGIDFENAPQNPAQVFIFHGGNQAIQAALLGLGEAHRERCGTSTPPTVMVPLPTFSCPLDQIALQGMHTVLLPPVGSGMDPHPDDLNRIPDDVDIDGVYMMPVNNPTGRTVPPGQLKAFIEETLTRWPHAGIILDSVYVRLHPQYRELLAFFNDEPRFADAILIVDSLSKTHGVTGLRSGAILTKADRFCGGITRYSQNILAGPSCAMQAVVLSLLAPFSTCDDLAEHRIRLQLRIGRHLQRRRRLLLERIFEAHGDLLHPEQPLLPDPVTFDWEGSMYADLQLSDRCHDLAAGHGVSPTVGFYLETGVAGVPLDGFCRNPNLEKHDLVVNGDAPELKEFQTRTTRFVRLSFGMTPPPR
jgi:aspartate/methionine/tyrosine aminotransferase